MIFQGTRVTYISENVLGQKKITLLIKIQVAYKTQGDTRLGKPFTHSQPKFQWMEQSIQVLGKRIPEILCIQFPYLHLCLYLYAHQAIEVRLWFCGAIPKTEKEEGSNIFLPAEQGELDYKVSRMVLYQLDFHLLQASASLQATVTSKCLTKFPARTCAQLKNGRQVDDPSVCTHRVEGRELPLSHL